MTEQGRETRTRTAAASLIATAIAVSGSPATAMAQGKPADQVMGQIGVCENVQIAGQTGICSGTGIMYMHLANDTVFYLVPLSDG